MNYSKHAGMDVYEGICDILSVPEFDDYKDGNIFETVGQVLCESGLSTILGIALLHSHFSMSNSELLVERVQERCLISAPMLVRKIRDPIHPIIWRTQESRERPIAIHWRRGIDPAAERIALFFSSVAFREICKHLASEQNRFGLIRKSRLESDLDFSKYNMLESTFLEERNLVSEIADSRVSGRNIIQTAWYFDEPEYLAAKECNVVHRRICVRNCGRTCRASGPGPADERSHGDSHNGRERHGKDSERHHFRE
jgi:hypothetical protein